ncbi:glycine betaine ABC transporter substrate-binding protein, partial [Burkholderia sp. SIMBA_062]
DEPRGLIWLNASTLNDTYAIGLPSEFAQQTGIKTVSQLADYLKSNPKAKRMVFGMDAEFANRPDGLKPLLETYGMH